MFFHDWALKLYSFMKWDRYSTFPIFKQKIPLANQVNTKERQTVQDRVSTVSEKPVNLRYPPIIFVISFPFVIRRIRERH